MEEGAGGGKPLEKSNASPEPCLPATVRLSCTSLMKHLLCLLLFTLTAGAANVRVEDVPERGVQPQVVVDAAGTAHLIYLKGDAQHTDVRYVHRAKGVRAWSAPVAVNNEPGTAVAMGTIRGAQLALGQKGTLHVVWNGAMKPGIGGAAQGMPLYYARLEPGQTAFAPQRNLLGETGALDGGASIAADEKGDVFAVWHGKAKGAAADETGRVVFVLKSSDNGATFGTPQVANADFAGTCACCSIKAIATPDGQLKALYRAAHTLNGRDLTLLETKDAATFKHAVLDPWKYDKCPMSSAALLQTPKGIRAAWETDGKIRSALLGSTPATTEIAAGSVKHPALAINARGETLAVWTTGTGWAKGGDLAWAMLDASGKPTADRGKAPGVPVWSHAAAYAEPDGGFVIVR